MDVARRVHSTMGLPMVLAGDANVWHLHFHLGRVRPVDNLIIPFIDLLLSSCDLVLCNPADQPTHNAGAALDLVFVSSTCPAAVRVHDGHNCCEHALACCPLLRSDHYLCVVSTSIQMDHIPPAPCGLPLLRDWGPFSCVLTWTCVIGLPRSRNSLLPAVLSTWCSENEGWTSYIQSCSPSLPRMLQCRTESADDCSHLGGTQTVCLRALHGMVLFGTTGEHPAQSLMRDSDQLDMLPPHHPQCPACILDKLARPCVRVVGVEPPCCCGHSSTDFPASRRGSARSAGAVARLSWWRRSV